MVHMSRPELDAARDPGVAYSFWQATLDALPETVAVLNPFGEIVAVNDAWRAFAAANGGGDVGVGADYLAACVGADDPVARRVGEALRELLAGTRDRFECTYPCHAPGQERWFMVRARPFPADGARRLVVTHSDITERYLAERRANEQAALLDVVDAAVIALGPDRRVTYWNAGAQALYGWTAEEVVGRTVRELTLAPETHGRAAAVIKQLLRDGQWEGHFDVRDREGREFPVYARNRLLRDADGEPAGFIGVSVDMTDRFTMERQLTGARDFLSTVTDTVPDGLYVLDPEGRVTLVNRAAEELLGWQADELIGEVMHHRTHYRRVDGSPFPMEDCPITRARATGETVRVEDDIFIRRDGTELPVAYASAPFTAENGERGWVVVFNDISERKERELRLRRELEALSWVGRIRDALEHDRLTLYAQPIVDLSTGETVQHELLLRMIGLDGRVIAPNEFLPAAEQHGLIGPIDRWVFGRALEIAMEGHPVEINVSADSLSDASFLSFVKAELVARDVDPALLVFEITETALMGNETVARSFVDEVRQLGCEVALDDFGTGYGSFRYLKHLPVNVLKIDQEFVRDLDAPEPETSRHVIQAIVSLARGMGQKTVAEGVETQSALDTLRLLGVDMVQGYLLGRPSPAETELGLHPHGCSTT
jgi:PAS domain S-box-containing protein